MRWRRRYRIEAANLERARAALPAVRRVLANTPAYMIFDDHDVTDDWNLTRWWRDGVRASPTGRRIIANALAAFWAFQGWGNEPGVYDEAFIATISDHVARGADGDAFDSLLWDFERWSFYAPTSPPTIFLDTRTQRDYDSPEGAARLLGKKARGRAEALAREAGHRPGERLVAVSPVPVFGLELQERRQKFLADKLGPYEIDFEAWHSNLHGLVQLMEMLVEELRVSSCVLVSGDIHYGCNARSSFSVRGRHLPVAQVVSSGYKHAGIASKAALDLLGSLVHERHERLGWHRPPEVQAPPALRRALVTRRVNTDEWDEDAPVFLAPRDVRLLGIETPPDYVEERVYVRPSEDRSSYLIPENNTGYVTVEEDAVKHVLLSRARDVTHVHTARIDLREGTR